MTLGLDVGAGQRAGDGLIGAAAALTQYLLAGVFASIALGLPGFGAHEGLGSRLLAASIAVGIYALGRWGRRQLRRALDTDTQLIVQAGCVVVRHNGLLAAPTVIPREALSLVAIDPAARASSKHSLPVMAEGGKRRLTWLWERSSGAPLPLLGLPTRAPNLALLFDPPVDFVPAGGRGPDGQPGAAEAGLLLRVNDTGAAERAFASWGVVRAATGDDLARARRLRIAAV